MMLRSAIAPLSCQPRAATENKGFFNAISVIFVNFATTPARASAANRAGC
jgi:hypothetical protein